MLIPLLEKSGRSREYDSYTPEERLRVVEAYLFKGLSHRRIDSEVLGLDDSFSHGYQAMGILHYLGLNASFKGIFIGMDVKTSISELKALKDTMYDELITLLSGKKN